MVDRATTIQMRIPSATYRLQFNSQFTLKQAIALVEYFYDLGISDCYTSSLLMARPGSLHGYDVTDHTKFNPEIGSEEELIIFAQYLKQKGMGILMDVVPNHMCIADSTNRWWSDVLENGPSSPFAKFFDIDWQPPKADLADKILLPVLGDQYGRVLENQEIKVTYQRGAFFAHYYETRLPIAPRTYTQILEPMLPTLKTQLGDPHPHVLELESIITALGHLPPRTETDKEKIRERQREKEIIKRRLSSLVRANNKVRRILLKMLQNLNGTKGAPRSFDRLENLLASQAYRLCFWRVAADEINYRRFFDINELAAIRVEEPTVFTAMHELIFRLVRQGWITGLRIDHVDGLFDPEQYFRDLQQKLLHSRKPKGSDKPYYVVVEKILGHLELLRPEWAVHGTTGYEFLNLLNGVFVDTTQAQLFRQLYERFTSSTHNFSDLVYECKKLILHVAMSSELHVLARRLDRISEQHRYSRDFTLNSLQDALGEVIACFPVYRTYARNHHAVVSPEDRRHIISAVRAAKRRNPAISPSIFDFIGSILLLEHPDGIDEVQQAERRDFVMRFQQLTGPVMAKGLEDTAFYRYYPLASLAEVGGGPDRFGISIEAFHRENQQRLQRWPHGLSATSTHDTKRSEDVRARINVLSEIPAEWENAICHWQSLNRDKKIYLDDIEVPDANEEYLLYQILIGAWPLDPMDSTTQAEFVKRIQEYMVKAIKEAKIHSSWISPNEEYEQAVRDFVQVLLKLGEENRFLAHFTEFQAPIARAGIFNSLSQTLLKTTSPGVPDFYQGTEIWDFSLVDPDNRRPVDYAHRQALLSSLRAEEGNDKVDMVNRLLENPVDGRIKLYLTSRALAFRRTHHALFASGAYLPLRVIGNKENQVLAFARVLGERVVIVVAGRFFTQLEISSRLPVGRIVWGDSAVCLEKELAAGCYRDVFTGSILDISDQKNRCELPLANVLAHLPVALLERI